MPRAKFIPNCRCPRRADDRHRHPCPYASRPVPRGAAGRVAVSPGVYADWLVANGKADYEDGWAAMRRSAELRQA